MKRAQTTLLILLMLSLSVSAQTARSSSKTYQHTRKLLSRMKDYDSSLYSIDDPEFDVLFKRIPSYGKKPRPKESRGDNRLHLRSPMAALFRTGDERIEDLIKALDDPDSSISLHAQIVIRYLGNERGMRALLAWYDKQDFFPIAGAVPLPLNKWDFIDLKADHFERLRDKGFHTEAYVYALALDDSPEAKELMKLVSEKNGDLPPVKSVLRSQPDKLLAGDKDLARLVLSHAFFISPDQKKSASAKFLSFNGAKNKALIEVLIDPSTWYYVVISRKPGGWKFFSITSLNQNNKSLSSRSYR